MTTIRSQVTGVFDKLVAKQPDAVQTGIIQQPTPTGTGGGPTDTTGGVPGVTPSPASARMVVLDIDVKRVDGTNIRVGDHEIIVEPTSIEITLEDKITCDRGLLTIASFKRTATGGETALYELICRK